MMIILDLFFLAASVAQVFICPHTKVEESFNMQATHDLLAFSPLNLTSSWDHFSFPGAVPRTFIGPLLLYTAAATSPVLLLLSWFLPSAASQSLITIMPKSYLKIFIRCMLGMGLTLSLRSVRKAIKAEFGAATSVWFGIINLLQFHLVFWGTRTLPNIFALIAVNYALSAWIGSRNSSMEGSLSPWMLKDYQEEREAEENEVARSKKYDGDIKQKPSSTSESPSSSTSTALRNRSSSTKTEVPSDSPSTPPPALLPIFSPKLTVRQGDYLALFTFATAIFRSELLAFVIPICASEIFLFGRLPLVPALQHVSMRLSQCIALTLIVDSFYWDELMFWPELRVLWFNTYQNKSHEWGTLPIHSYFSSLLPRIAPLSYPFAIFAFFLVSSPRVRIQLTRYLLPCAVFVAMYSLLPHKEWRFVVYVVPVLNLGAAVACQAIFSGWLVGNSLATTKEKPKEAKSVFRRIQAWILMLMLINSMLTSLAMSALGLYTSSLNYPGGDALSILHKRYPSSSSPLHSPLYVHIDAYSAMSGITRFDELSEFKYSKVETHTEEAHYAVAGYTHLLIGGDGADDRIAMLLDNGNGDWDILETVVAFDRISMRRGGIKQWVEQVVLESVIKRREWGLNLWEYLPIEVKTAPKVWILERRDFL